MQLSTTRVYGSHVSDFNQRIIDEFRANQGYVQTAGFGSGLVLLHTVGAKTGEPRVSPVLGVPHHGAWLVVASKAGSPTNPAWYHNLLAHPDVTVETGVATVEVTAAEVGAEEYDEAWALFVGRSPGFEEYKERAGGRVLPIVRLAPR